MKALAGWGFATQNAFDRYLTEGHSEEDGRPGKSAYVSDEAIREYAATLTKTPTAQAVRSHFDCKIASAYNYRRRVIAMLAKRAREGA